MLTDVCKDTHKAIGPTRAIVLAAGFGTRMLPLTQLLPKPLLPFWGQPILEHILELLATWGVEEVLINCHHKADMIFDFARTRTGQQPRIDLMFEPEILGTGGVLQQARGFVESGPFWLINADIAARLDPTPLTTAFHKQKPLATLWLTPDSGPRTVETKQGLVTSFRSQHPGTENTATFCGLHLLSPRILQYLPKQGFANIITAYEKGIQAREIITGTYCPDSFWADMGTPEQYLAAHADTPIHQKTGNKPDNDVQASGFVSLAPGVEVHAKAQLKNVIACHDSKLTAQACLTDAIVAPHTRVTSRLSGMILPATYALIPAETDALKRVGWNLRRTVAAILPPRGSARSFLRLCKGRKSLVLVRYDPERTENLYYAEHARFLLDMGLNVPIVLHDDPRKYFTIFEDMGLCDLRDSVADDSTQNKLKMYRRVLDQVLLLHERGATQAVQQDIHLMPPFSTKLYKWEHSLFLKHFTAADKTDSVTTQSIQKELSRIARSLNRCPQVLLHRDLQSSNIIVKKRRPGFIDFQGMRLGPAAYDLASLLCDPYMMLTETVQSQLLEHYATNVPDGDHIREIFWSAAIQRLVQALGAYRRMGNLLGASRFLKHVRPALTMLDRALTNAPQRHTALIDLVHTLTVKANGVAK